MEGPGATILYVNTTGDTSGAENSLLVLLKQLDRRFFIPRLLCPFEGSFTHSARQAGIPVTIAPVQAFTLEGSPAILLGNLVRSFQFGWQFARYLRREQIQLLHINSFRIAVGCGLAGRLAGIPVVWHVRDFPPHPVKRWVVMLLSLLLADRVITVSEAAAETFRLGGRRLSRVEVIYNGIDADQFQPDVSRREKMRAELGLESGSTLIVNVGALYPWKGQDLFLRAAARLTARRPDARFLVIGDQLRMVHPLSAEFHHFKERLLQLHEALQLQDVVRFLGARPDVPDLLQAADIFVHTAIWPDPLPRSVLEAMASGKAIVAPAIGGIPEMVRQGESAVLYPPGDLDQLTEAIAGLIADPQRRAALGEAARREASRRFTVSAHVQAVEAVYRSFLTQARGFGVGANCD